MDSRRKQYWNRFSLVSSVDSEIGRIDRNNRVPRVQFAHSNQTQIGKIRLAISIAPGKFLQLGKVPGAIER